MHKFTVESTYHLPVYRHRTYDAATPADACRKAIGDDDWSAGKCVRPNTSRSCSISWSMSPDQQVYPGRISIVGCQKRLRRSRRQGRSSRNAAIPMCRQSRQGHDQHQRSTRILAEQTVRQFSDEALLAVDVSNAAHAAKLVRRDV